MFLVFSIIILASYFILLLRFSNGIYYINNQKKNDYNPYVSIVVSARNEEKNISKLISCLLNQDYSNNQYEIIIVNDRSFDSTHKIVSDYSDKFSNIKLINIKKTPLGWGSKKWALTQAIKSSNGEIILQTDADCLPSKTWVSSLVRYFSKSKIGFVCGPSPLIHSDIMLNKIFQMESMVQEAINAGGICNNMIISCTGRNIAFRREIFNQINGYLGHEHILSGDDDLLLQKFALESNCLIKYAISKNSIVPSYAPFSFFNFLKQRLRFASKGFFYFKIKTTIEFKFIILFLYIVNIVTILNLFVVSNTLNFYFFIPIAIKMLSDFLLSYVFMIRLKLNWSLMAYLVLTLLHPFYVVIIGALGPFSKVDWKK